MQISYDEIKQVVKKSTYLENLTKLEYILSCCQDISMYNECEQLEMLYYAMNISKKYNKNYDQVINLFDKFEAIHTHFSVVYRKFYFFKTTEEQKSYINNLKIIDIDLACRILQKIISENKVKKIPVFKKLFCEICTEMVYISKNNIYKKSEYVQQALKFSKELNEKSLYKTLILIDKQCKKDIISSMEEMTFIIPKEVNDGFSIIENSIRDIISKLTIVEELIAFFVNDFCIITKGVHFTCSLSKESKWLNDVNIHNNTIIDLISWNTYDDMKSVKPQKIEEIAYNIIRKIMIMKIVIPIIEEGVKNMGTKIIIDYLIHSCIVFDEDRGDIEFALNAFFNKDYRTFIYYIIPNIEKLLRNILDLHNIPTYQNNSSNSKYQSTFVMTDSLKMLEVEQIFDEELVEFLANKLNNPNFENYRNRLSHKLDNDIFCYECASDLLRILIVILFCYEKNNNYSILVGEVTDINDFFRDLGKKIEIEK